MKKLLEKAFNTRLGKYIAYAALYFIILKFTNFESTMIIIGATILGELDYQYLNKKENETKN